MFRRKLACKIFGCCWDEHCHCHRCGGDYEDPECTDMPCRAIVLIDDLAILIRRFLKCLRGRNCEVCNRHFFRGFDEYTCCKDCSAKWMPF